MTADLIAKARAWAANFASTKGAERLNSVYYINALADELEALQAPHVWVETTALGHHKRTYICSHCNGIRAEEIEEQP